MRKVKVNHNFTMRKKAITFLWSFLFKANTAHASIRMQLKILLVNDQRRFFEPR